jgi:hypothetical protein
VSSTRVGGHPVPRLKRVNSCRNGSATGRQNITVTYVVGFLNPPPVARMVALTCLQSMWQESQQASHPLLDESAEFAVSNAVAGLPGPLRQAYDSLRTVGVA